MRGKVLSCECTENLQAGKNLASGFVWVATGPDPTAEAWAELQLPDFTTPSPLAPLLIDCKRA
jgi:hypothetical protein